MPKIAAHDIEGGRSVTRRGFLQASACATACIALGLNRFPSASHSIGNSSRRPNILLITTDEQRYDAIGCSGNRAILTPNLDALAAKGVRFARTYCQGPLCQPSRASLLTGRYVHQHGQSWNRITMKPQWPTMMKQLQAAGYRTAYFGKTHFWARPPARTLDLRDNADFVRSFGIDDVMEEFDKHVHLHPGVMTPYTEYLKTNKLFDVYLEETPGFRSPGARVEDLYTGKTSRLPQEHDLTSFVADRAIDWLRGYHETRPFFLWVSFIAPHPPMIDDSKWAAHYKDVEVPLGPARRPHIQKNAYGRFLGGYLRWLRTERITPDLVSNAARHYYGMISLIDQRIGDLIKTLETQGKANDTWIFFTSDHGEMLGDHGLMFKNVFYKGAVLVPTILRPPGGTSPRVIDGLTQSIDITATILDVGRAGPLEGAEGRSLLPFLDGRDEPREAAFSEVAGFENKNHFFVMVATKRYRYLYDRQNDLACELFDLQEDPDELENRIDDPGFRSIRRELHGELLEPFLKS